MDCRQELHGHAAEPFEVQRVVTWPVAKTRMQHVMIKYQRIDPRLDVRFQQRPRRHIPEEIRRIGADGLQ